MKDEKGLNLTNRNSADKSHEPEFKNPASNLSRLDPRSAKLKILLWDIDGTLMSSTQTGSFREYFEKVMLKVYGSAGRLETLQVSGMTDTQIFYESLKDEGFTPERILEATPQLLPIFKEEMSRVVEQNKHAYRMFPGVREILEATSKNPNFLNVLLTGNLSVAAEIKLSYFDLWKYFETAPNIFGEISHDRRELGKAAPEIISSFLGVKLEPKQFIVIGDTPNDIAAARAFGATMVSVATGRNHPPEELAKFGPDIILKDLSDTAAVLNILENL
jgi:phosphoglycolate phosphatase-like HAD superfamily hydrolase